MSINDMDNAWKIEKDPLEITEEIDIKEENYNQIKQEDIYVTNYIILGPVIENQTSIKTENDNLDISSSINNESYSDIKETPQETTLNIVNNELNTSCSENVNLSDDKLSLKNSDIDKSAASNESTCNCMDYIGHYCTTCNKISKYCKTTTQCFDCKTPLKLQCIKCNKRFKVLNTVHQCLLQVSKQLNLFSNSNSKEVKFKCKKEQLYYCTVCNYRTKLKKLFINHIKNGHNNPNTYACSKCLYTTEQKESLITHLKNSCRNTAPVLIINDNYDQIIELVCVFCTAMYKKITQNDNFEHICHKCQKPMIYRCAICFETREILNDMRFHIKCNSNHHRNSEKLHCLHCHFETEFKSTLEDHMELNHNLYFKNINQLKENLDQQTFSKIQDARKIHASKDNILESDITRSNLLIKEFGLPKNIVVVHIDYEIVSNDPQTLFNEMVGKSQEILNPVNWKALIDCYCLKCDKETVLENFTGEPMCSKCKIKCSYRCKTCGKLNNKSDAIQRHITSECIEQTTVQCSICNQNCKRQHLHNHIKNKHTLYKCLRCDYALQGYMSLRCHQSSQYCKNNSKHYNIHVKRLVGYYCKNCQKKMGNFDNRLIKSCPECKKLMSYQCLKCDKLFTSKCHVYLHIKENCTI